MVAVNMRKVKEAMAILVIGELIRSSLVPSRMTLRANK